MHIKLDLTKFKLSKHTALCSAIACSILYPESTKLYLRERERERKTECIYAMRIISYIGKSRVPPIKHAAHICTRSRVRREGRMCKALA